MLGNLRLSLLEGDIQIKTVDLGDWSPASINLPLKEGDELWIPESGRRGKECRGPGVGGRKEGAKTGGPGGSGGPESKPGPMGKPK